MWSKELQELSREYFATGFCCVKSFYTEGTFHEEKQTVYPGNVGNGTDIRPGPPAAKAGTPLVLEIVGPQHFRLIDEGAE
jgi:hypothetical protein